MTIFSYNPYFASRAPLGGDATIPVVNERDFAARNLNLGDDATVYLDQGYTKIAGTTDNDVWISRGESRSYTYDGKTLLGNCTWVDISGFDKIVFTDGVLNVKTGEMEPLSLYQNEAPVLVNADPNELISVDENTSSVRDFVAFDPDGDVVTYSIVDGADSGLFKIDPLTGKLDFITPPDFETDKSANDDGIFEVTIKATDPKGGEDTADVRIVVKDMVEGPSPDANSAPVANFDVVEGTISNGELVSGPLSFLTANDTDADGDTLTVISATSDKGAAVNLVDTNGDGVPDTITYDASASPVLSALTPGQTAQDTVTYTVTDGNGKTDTAQVSLTIGGTDTGGGNGGGGNGGGGNGGNTAPVANDDVVDVIIENDAPVSGALSALLANDFDADGNMLRVVEAVSAKGAAIKLTDTDGDGIADMISYDPTTSAELHDLGEGQIASDVVTYKVSDGMGGYDTADVYLTVVGHDCPVDETHMDEDMVGA